MRKHKAWGVIGGIIPPRPHSKVERSPAYYDGPYGREICLLPLLNLAPSLSSEHPVGEHIKTLQFALGVVVILRPSDETIQRHAHIEEYFSHKTSYVCVHMKGELP